MTRLTRLLQFARNAATRRVLPNLNKANHGFNHRLISNAMNEQSRTSSSHVMLGLLGAGALVGLGQALADRWEEQDYQSSIKNLDDLEKTHKWMQYALTNSSEQIEGIAKAINEAVTKANEKNFAIFLDKLFKMSVVSDDYLELLVNTCAIQGKVSLLKILSEEFNCDDFIEKNPIARALIKHPFFRRN